MKKMRGGQYAEQNVMIDIHTWISFKYLDQKPKTIHIQHKIHVIELKKKGERGGERGMEEEERGQRISFHKLLFPGRSGNRKVDIHQSLKRSNYCHGRTRKEICCLSMS